MRRYLDQALDHHRAGDPAAALDALARVARSEPDFTVWAAADRLLARLTGDGAVVPWSRRTLRLALLSSHTSGQLAGALRVAALAHGIALETHETGYRAYEQAVLDPASDLYAFAPDVVLLVIDQRDLHLPDLPDDPRAAVDAEAARWAGLWDLLRGRTGATVVQTTFVPAPDDALGGLGAVLPAGRTRLVRAVNAALADRLPPGTHLVDAETAAAEVGLGVWFDERFWHTSKHAVGLGAVGTLAARAVDVVAAAAGLSRKVVVLDLDNTLWGGVVGEDGVAGLTLGDGPAGEAFVAFQRYVSSLRRRGLVLAVSSKNDPADARAPFTGHPDMVLRLDDVVSFQASWGDKPSALRTIAADLDLGLDALVLVDDNPLERERVHHELPQVAVVDLPADPSGYVRALARFPGLQAVTLSAEDGRRTEQYHARARARDVAARAGTPEEFLAGLEMSATVEDLDETTLPRIVQLIGKTNQLNLTGRRHTAPAVRALAATPGAVVWGLRVRDRFDDHGLVAALVAVPDGDALVLDTFVMSCRVLGRTAENAFLAALVDHARDQGFARVVGHFVPSGRNTPAAPVLPATGFSRVDTPDATDEHGHGPTQTWEIATGREPQRPGYIALTLPRDHQTAGA